MGSTQLILIAIIIGGISNNLYNRFCDFKIPQKQIDPNPYWGPSENFDGGQLGVEDSKIYPFKINVDEKVLTDLKIKLKEELNSQKYTPSLEGLAFEYGFNSKYLQKVLNYWHTNYNWRESEKKLNLYPQFKTKIEGLDIHFQHILPKVKGSTSRPLLLLHGWPGSFVELQKMIPILQESDANFELIIPSLPGYGFSQGSSKKGLGPLQIGQIFLKLMKRLGHQQFYLHGGDWGGIIVTTMATLYPENVKAVHSNACVNFHPRSFLRTIFANYFPSLVMSKEERPRFEGMQNYINFIFRETGYLHIQATKPDTVGIGLLHSPSGLAGYIVEKFSTWTKEAGIFEKDGGIEKAFTMDEVLDNVMIYWVTNSITTSMRLYSEYFSPEHYNFGLERIPVKVPMGCILANDDGYLRQSEWVLRDKFPNIVRFTLAPVGGHFLALEHPKLLADDIIQFFRKL